MQLENNEYGIGVLPTNSGFADAIIITKEALQKWSNHYFNNASEFCLEDGDETAAFKFGFYSGKQEVLIDLLKHFKEE